MLDPQKQKFIEKQIAELCGLPFEQAEYALLNLMGFFSVILSGPRMIQPSEWTEFLDSTLNQNVYTDDMQAILLAVRNAIAAELQVNEYRLTALKVIQTSGLPAGEVTELLSEWLHGFWLGIELIEFDWRDTGHSEADGLGVMISRLEINFNEYKKDASDEDFETVRRHVKLFHDYWVEHRECEGKPKCILSQKSASSQAIQYELENLCQEYQ